MAKKSMIAREVKRTKLVARYAKKRATIKAALQKAYKAEEDGVDVGDQIVELQRQLSKLPLDSNPIRGRTRCRVTGRPRGVYRKFGLGRNKLREYAMSGDIPGLTKASW